jgi:hypothetical protein
LSIISKCSTVAARDVLALAELTAITALQLGVVRDAYNKEQLPSVAELSPLTQLTALQQLKIIGWQPLKVAGEELPAAVPAAADACCLPASITSLQLHNIAMNYNGIGMWLPSVLACTGLQHLHMRVTWGSLDVSTIMNACIQHLTGKCTETATQHNRHSSFTDCKSDRSYVCIA